MTTGCGPPRSGWVMKVVVWPSLVGISICWSVMAFLYLLRFCLALSVDTIARKPEHDKAIRALTAIIGLEPRLQNRHCLVELTVRSRPEISQDDPDQQSVFRRDRASDERRRRRRPGRQARGRYGGPQSGRKNPARPRHRQARGVRGGQGHGAAGAGGKRGAESAPQCAGSQARGVVVSAG